MRKLRIRRSLIIPALLMVVLGAAVAGQAPASARAVALDGEDLAYAAPSNGVSRCNGGAQFASLVTMSDTPTSIGENPTPVPLTDAEVSFTVPDSAQVVVTFDAEARLTGQPNTLTIPVDFLRVQIMISNAVSTAPMPPDNDLMFTTDVGQSNATQACRRVPPGDYTVWVAWQVVDQAAPSMLTGSLDDWLLKVELNA